MMFSVPLLALFGASMATSVRVRQDNGLEARVKALEDFLAAPDSACVKTCGKAWDTCADACPDDFASEDYDFALEVCLSDCDKTESMCNGKCTKSFPPK